MSKVTVTDKMPNFKKLSVLASDRALERMSVDILRLSQIQVPYKEGDLKASGSFTKLGSMSYLVEYTAPYAMIQEEGVGMVNYTTPGTKAHYLRDPGELIGAKAVEYFKQEVAKIVV